VRFPETRQTRKHNLLFLRPTPARNTQTATKFVPTSTQILSTDTLTPTAKPGHALETPIGLVDKSVIHRVKAGESLVSIANHYATTVEAIKAINYFMTPLHLLDFQKSPTILSHFDDFFGVIMGQERFSKAFFTKLLPLSPNGNGMLTFLQQSY